MPEFNVYDLLEERGFLQQVTNKEEIRRLLNQESVTFYIGFDATATSLHAGSLVPIMAMAWLQKAGHKPIALLGTGTTMVGDPSGKTESRPLLTKEEINRNCQGIKANLERYLDLSEGKGMLLANGEWLQSLNYLDFLREIGRHFSVNRMLAAEAYKIRMESGLSFLEFNYQILQAYDFLVLNRDHNCMLQAGGDDQWGNMVAGTDLIRRVRGPERDGQAEAFTFPLLVTATGAKMGKTEQGAVWLSPDLLSPYDYYQYWINIDDRDVKRFLNLFTFLPKTQVEELVALAGAEIRQAKEVLAFEATMLCHGKAEADQAREQSRNLFGGKSKTQDAPTIHLGPEEWVAMTAAEVFVLAGHCSSKGEARRLIKQGGAYLDGERVSSFDFMVDLPGTDPEQGLMVRAGKKKYCRLCKKG